MQQENFLLIHILVKKHPLFNIYWSKPQLKVRHHTNMVKVQKALLNLWNKCEGLDDTVNLEQPLTFNDRLRFRKPNTEFKLGPHWDGGSLQRWANSDYQVKFFPVKGISIYHTSSTHINFSSKFEYLITF